MANIHCYQCGQANSDQSRFCRYCGTSISAVELRSDYANQAPRPHGWKTDEYQTQSEARSTVPLNHAQPYSNQPFDGRQNFPPAPLVYQQPAVMIQPVIMGVNKSRVAYILLGLFLGGLGIHNFYAGYSGKGVAQLLLNIFFFWTIIVPIAIGIWALIEVITVDHDAYGNRMT